MYLWNHRLSVELWVAPLVWCLACKSAEPKPGSGALSSALLSSSAAPSAGAAAPSLPTNDVVTIVQSRSIGFISLNMSSDQLRALPVQWQVEAPGSPQDTTSLFRSGPWYVVVERGVVTSVELELRSGVQAAVGDNPIPPGASLEAIAALFTECKPIERTEDGEQIECDKRRTTVKRGQAGAPVTIQLLSEAVVRAIYGTSG